MPVIVGACSCGFVATTTGDFLVHDKRVGRAHRWVDVPDLIIVRVCEAEERARKPMKVCRSCNAPYDCKAWPRGIH